MRKINTGVSSEQEFEDKLKARHGKRCFIHRITDTKEIRGRTGKSVSTKAQPSDYILTINGAMAYAEVKSCNNKISFPFSQIEHGQWAAAKKQLLARGTYLFFIHNLQRNIWYRVPAEFIFSHKRRSIKWAELDNLNLRWII